MALPKHLAELAGEILEKARKFGLDPFKTIFEVVNYEVMNEIASYGGFPTRYPHWRFGMEYERLSKSHSYGLSKIYEMVINNDPTFAYLLEGNNLVDQKTVMGHVYAHSDFFHHNLFFSHTDRGMMNEMANHAARIRSYAERFGVEKVESFIDICLSLDNLIDIHSPFRVKKRRGKEEEQSGSDGESDPDKVVGIHKLRSKEYMEEYINPREFIDQQRQKLLKEQEQQRRIPARPEQDVLQFLLDHAPLERWQADILSIVREEAFYFAPQMQTKIMNEGWATYWHSRIMTEKALKSSEVVDYAESYSKVVATAPGQFNPYKIGVELFRDIFDRWNKGRFGKEWEECEDIARREAWDLKLGQGNDKIFLVRKLYNDVTFIDEFLTEDFCRRHKLFTFALNRRKNQWEIESREFQQIKEKLLFALTNFGQPTIFVIDANFENRAELLLHHKHQGVDLQTDYSKAVLENLYQIWTRPVNIQTVTDQKGTMLRFDGTEHSERSIDYEPIR
ncbi:MAG: SpoVR family protein [Bradymonadales bacterium]|nr:SpoVR family protein [Bradymonadales bacterium]